VENIICGRCFGNMKRRRNMWAAWATLWRHRRRKRRQLMSWAANVEQYRSSIIHNNMYICSCSLLLLGDVSRCNNRSGRERSGSRRPSIAAQMQPAVANASGAASAFRHRAGSNRLFENWRLQLCVWRHNLALANAQRQTPLLPICGASSQQARSMLKIYRHSYRKHL
jgi:hypothetical protein